VRCEAQEARCGDPVRVDPDQEFADREDVVGEPGSDVYRRAVTVTVGSLA